MFFLQRNMSPLFYISHLSSLSVTHVSGDILKFTRKKKDWVLLPKTYESLNEIFFSPGLQTLHVGTDERTEDGQSRETHTTIPRARELRYDKNVLH